MESGRRPEPCKGLMSSAWLTVLTTFSSQHPLGCSEASRVPRTSLCPPTTTVRLLTGAVGVSCVASLFPPIFCV